MRRLLLWLPIVMACAPTDRPGSPCMQITDRAQLAGCVGQRVTVRGTVTRTKQPTILGVDVDAEYALSDRTATATGVLRRYTIEPPDPDATEASRGPGTYYALRDPSGLELAKARAAP